MDYIEKAEAALIQAEEKIAAGESTVAKEWIEVAGRWKDLAALKTGELKLPPFVAPKLPRPVENFRGGLYL